MTKKLRSIYDSKEEFLGGKSTVLIISSKNNILSHTLALLNSKLMSFTYKKLFKSLSLSGGYMRVGPPQIKKLPYKKIQSRKISRINTLTKRILELNNKKTKENRNFLKWISNEWEVDLEELSLKSHLIKYWKYDFKEIIRMAKKNRSKIKGSPSSRKFQEVLEKEWRKSIDKLKPLIREIRNHENQIDAIVFKLYDLTEDEIIKVLDSLGTEDKIKEYILEKFRELK